MLAFSIDALTGFSTAPLRLATVLGVGGAVASFLFGVYVVLNRFGGHPVPGWASTVLIVVTMGAVQLLCLGLIGEYIARMYGQMQGRPLYFIAHDTLLDDSDQAAASVRTDDEQMRSVTS